MRAQRAFVATMSHEVRTPLNAILGMSELLAQTPLATDQRKYVEIARRCGRALQGLLDNALELSRIESGGVEIAHEPFDLESVVHECLETFAFAAHQKGIALVADLAEMRSEPSWGTRAACARSSSTWSGTRSSSPRGAASWWARSRTPSGSRSRSPIPASGSRTTDRRRCSSASCRRRRVRPAATAAAGLGSRCAGRWWTRSAARSRRERAGAGSVFRVVLPWRVEPRACAQTFAGRRVLALLGDAVERRSLAARLRAAVHGCRRRQRRGSRARARRRNGIRRAAARCSPAGRRARAARTPAMRSC